MSKSLSLLMFIFMGFLSASSQINPMSSAYYQNEFLNNPAMTGRNDAFNVNAIIRGQFNSNIPGIPATQALTADIGFNNKVGTGLLLYNESIGILNRTKVFASYAYHLKLDADDKRMSFGISAGAMYDWVDMSQAKGDESDMSLSSFNKRPAYLDADFGMAYEDKNLLVQLAFPNLKRLFNKHDIYIDLVNLSTFYAAAGYKISIEGGSQGSSITPKLSFRQIQNLKSVLDLSTEVNMMNEKFIMTGLYRTSKSYTLGAGTTYNNKYQVMCFYTSNTATTGSFVNGEFELGLRWKLRDKTD